ncbi:hypothetical protein Godav_027620 [Gossypium davidsonii]|uniref:Uncharacterized protein n=2 Tax=Gossypium TaxID=3633 RepID=A0A7J8RX65_GOSDV|nr:hypothetical protein [Gossypium davidsonii]MBA0653604.1 hypothetical protein [Gossypium klotzschianum]
MTDVKYHLAPNSIRVRIQGMKLDGINQKLHVQRVKTERWRLSESPYVKIYFDVTFQNHSKRSCTEVQMDLVLGFLEVEIEGDALTIVKKLHAIREDKYESGNRVAHLLAIEGIKRGVSTYLTQGMPFSAAIAVEKDWWWMDLPD